ncbi:MAG TPA: FAD-dependent oxidoreductase [Actinomycetales bacterium]|nr:FAD-dependent oxidoreductase [Actinomycetales bacterium]
MSKAINVPSRIGIVGAGTVGLATGWFLQEHGIEVTIFDKTGVAAGSSRGNAGWLTPGLAAPLPDPAVLHYGIKAVLSPASPVYVPPTLHPGLISFLVRFMRNSTKKRWQNAMRSLIPINEIALNSFDELTEGGVDEPTHKTDEFIAAFRTEIERAGMIEELVHIQNSGQQLEYEPVTGTRLREIEPALSTHITAGILLKGQRFVDPGAYAQSLADSFKKRGGQIITGLNVTNTERRGTEIVVELANGDIEVFDAVVLATGTWLNQLGRSHGVKKRVQAGRGYSFASPITPAVRNPIYFPIQRVACTPLGDRLRVAGMMEFRSPSAPLDPRRIGAIIAAARPLLRNIDLSDRQDEWVGSRPCTTDGLPLIGRTKTEGIYVAGGHGMWGITLGPATGKLLAEQMITGEVPTALRDFDPLR